MRKLKGIVPQFDELIIPTVKALNSLGGSGTNKEIDKKLLDYILVSKDAQEIIHKEDLAVTELEYRSAWARTYLKKVGIIDNPERSKWVLVKNVDAESICAKDVVELARLRTKEMAEKLADKNISKLEAVQVFESYVSRSIKDYLEFKNVFVEETFKADLYIKDGIADIKGPLYVEIKYNLYDIVNNLKNYCDVAKTWVNKNKESILFIIGGKLSDKEIITNRLKEEFDFNIVIWDFADLIKEIPTIPINLDYLDNPRVTIINDVLKETKENKLTKENNEKISSLKTAFDSGKLVLFLGAGVSIDAGVPLWDELINRLLLRMINVRVKKLRDENGIKDNIVFTEKDITKISELAFKNKEETPLMQMRYIRAALTNDDYYQAVHDELYANKINVNTKLLDAISKICMPKRGKTGLASVVTYNFDDLLEQRLEAKDIDYKVIQSDNKMPDSEKLNIYHVHGFISQNNKEQEEISELIFSEEDYHRVYGDAYCWSNMAQVKAFQDNICLFVGCSLTDPNLRRLLDNAIRQTDNTRHFAILKRKTLAGSKTTKAIKWYQDFDDAIRNQIFKNFGINIIWVNEYSEIPNILESIVK